MGNNLNSGAFVESKSLNNGSSRSEEKLAWLAAIVESSNDAIFSFTSDWEILSWNPGAEKVFGYTASEAIGQHLSKLIPSGYENEPKEIISKVIRGELVQQHETKRLRRDGSLIDVSLNVSPIKNDDGEVLGLMAIVQDITERKRAETAKFFLASIVESTEDSIVTVDFDGIITSWNRAAESLYGYSAREAIGTSLIKLTLPDNIKEVLANIDEIKHSQTVEVFDSVRVHKGGREMNLEVVMSPVKNASGQVIGVSTVARDVTERRQAQEVLRESEEKYRLRLEEEVRERTAELEETKDLLQTIFDTSPNSITAYKPVYKENRIDDFQIVFVNGFTEKTTGINPAGMLLTKAFPTAKENGFFDRLKHVTEQNEMQDFELWYEGEGLHNWFRMIAVPMEEMVLLTTEDITERKKAEQELKASKDLVQTVFDVSLNPIAYHKAVRDASGTIVDFEFQLENQEARKYAVEDRTGKRYSEAYPGIESSVVFKMYCDVVETGDELNTEVQLNLKGTDHWFHLMAVKLDDGLVATAVDITERKKAHEEILRLKDEIARRAEDKYRTLFETMDEGLSVSEVIYDDNGKPVDLRIIEANPAHEKITGLKNVAGKLNSECVPTEDYWLEAYDRVLKTGEPVRYENYHAELQQWLQLHLSRMGGAESRTVACVFEDITERKQREQQREFLLKLGDALRPLSDAVEIQRAAARVIGEFLEVDRAYYAEIEPDDEHYVIAENYVREGVPPLIVSGGRLADFGWAGEELHAGRTVRIADANTDPNLCESAREGFRALNITASLALPLIKEGRWAAAFVLQHLRPHEWTEEEIKLAQETAERTWAAVERAKAEEALRESEERLQSIANLVPDLLWDSEPNGSTNWYNERWLEYTGQSFEEAVGWGWMDAIHPEDREASTRRYHEAVENGAMLRQEHRIRRYDGEYRWFVVNAFSLKDESGQVIKIYGAATDIHELRIMHEALRESEEKFRTLADAAPALIWHNNPRGENVFINQYFLDFTGKTAEEIRGEGWQEIVHPEDAEDYINGYLEAVREGRSWSDQNRIRRYDGEWRWFDNYAAPLSDAGGAYLGHVGITIDITERRKAEKALRESEEKYRTLFDSIDEGFVLVEVITDDSGQAVDALYLEGNPAASQMTNVPDYNNRRLSEIMPDAESYWLEIYDRVSRTGVGERSQQYHGLLDRWFDFYVFPVDEAEHGESRRRVAVLFQDITERKEREAHQTFLLKLSDALRGEPDTDAVANRAMLMLIKQIGLDRSYIFSWNLQDDVGYVTHQLGNDRAPDLPPVIRPSGFPASVRVSAEGTLVIDDIFEHPNLSDSDRVNIAGLGMRSLVSATLRKWDYPLWSMVAVSAESRHWTQSEILLVEEVAERTWAAVERVRAEESLRLNEQRARIQKEAFQSAINGEPLASALNILTRIVKEQLGSDVRTAFYLAYTDGASLHAIDGAGDMPQTYTVPVDGFPIGEDSFCSGYAIATGRPALTRDVFEDLAWQPYLHLASAHNFRSSSSYPILTREGKAIGSFAMYFTEVHEATSQESAIADAVTQAAAIILARYTQALERARAEEALRESEEFNRSIVASSQDCLKTLDLEGTLLWMSDQGQRLLCIEDIGALLGKSWLEFWEGDDRAAAQKAVEAAASGNPTQFVGLFSVDNGCVRWFDVMVSPILGKDGKTERLLAVSRDITNSKRAEEAVRESEERLRGAISISTVGVMFWRKDYTLGDVNDAFLRMTGFSREDVRGKSWTDFTPPEFHEISRRGLEELVTRGEITPYEKQYIRKDGSRWWGLFSARSLGDEAVEFVIDITERKLAEEALRESEERLRFALEAASIGAWDLDLTTGQATRTFLHDQCFGAIEPFSDWSYEKFLSFVHPEDRREVERKFGASLAEFKEWHFECRVVWEDQSVHWIEAHGNVYRTIDGKPARMLGIVSDITERKRAEEALRESEQRLRLVVESVTDYAIITLDNQGIINGWNSGAEKMFGYSKDEAIGKHTDLIFTSEDREKGVSMQEIEMAQIKGRAEDERWHIRRDGTRFFVSGILTPLENEAEKGFVKIARDMTDKMQIEQALRDKEMLQKLVQTQEDERKRIARDLHDELGQQLTALRLKLENARKSCEEDNELCAEIDEIQTIAKHIDDGVDFLAWELRPAALDHLGLYAALDKYVKEWSQHSGVMAELISQGLKRARFNPAIEINLYRIVQEALNNTHKHAQAKRVEVVIEKRGDLIVLIIEDDGKGFNPESKKNRSKGLGLIGMQERAALIGGECEIESAEGQGTSIFVRVPISFLEQEKHDDE